MSKNILITGANGFIGSFLAEHLAEQGHRIRCAVRKNSNLRWLDHSQNEIFHLDWNNPDSLKSAVSDQDILFHLAGVTKAKSNKAYFTGNVGITQNLLDAFDRYGPAHQKVIYVSSQAAAGPSKDGTPVNENDPPLPVSVYGQAKLETEKIVLSYSKAHWATIIRPPSVYGPRDRDVFALFQNIHRGILPLLGNGTSTVSLVHVYDLVNGIDMAAKQDASKDQVFFICGDGIYDWSTIGDTIAHCLNKRPKKVNIPLFVLDLLSRTSEMIALFSSKPALLNRDKVQEMKQKHWVCSNEKAKKVLGFTPKISLQAGIKETADWYLEHHWL